MNFESMKGMKRTIIMLLVAALFTGSLTAQETKIPYFIIDGHYIEDFDGSQLKHETISNYVIDRNFNIHLIFTIKYHNDYTTLYNQISTEYKKIIGKTLDELYKHKSSMTNPLSLISKPNSNLCVYVIDDVIYTFDDFEKISHELNGLKDAIESYTVIKDSKSEIYKKYAKNGENSVILVTTKRNKNKKE